MENRSEMVNRRQQNLFLIASPDEIDKIRRAETSSQGLFFSLRLSLFFSSENSLKLIIILGIFQLWFSRSYCRSQGSRRSRRRQCDSHSNNI